MPPDKVRGSNDTTADRLRYELIRVQIETIKMSQDQLRLQMEKQEQRLRVVEETATKFNLLLYLTMGGGLIGLANLATLLMNR